MSTCRGLSLLRAAVPAACFLLLTISLSACSLYESATGGNASAPPVQGDAVQLEKKPTAMDTFRVLAPPEGMKFTPLFAVQVGDTDQRFARLENAVQSLRDDFDTVTPSLVRLVAVEKDIKNLVSQLETLTSDTAPVINQEPLSDDAASMPSGSAQPFNPNKIPGNAPVTSEKQSPQGPTPVANHALPVTPEAAPKGELPPEGAASHSIPAEAPQVAAALSGPPMALIEAQAQPSRQPAQAEQQQEASTGRQVRPAVPVSGSVRSVRIGDHMDKTRIVLDITENTSARASLQNGGRKLVIDLSGLDFTAAKTWDAMSAALVAGYKFENGILTFDLLYSSSIRQQNILPPNGDSKSYRLLIDLYSSDVHQ